MNADKRRGHDREPEWLHKHVHEPNPSPPTASADIIMVLPDRQEYTLTLSDLAAMDQSTVRDCTIVSTGHGASGPFSFRGVSLFDFITSVLYGVSTPSLTWSAIDMISADGFGNRVLAEEVACDNLGRPMLLAIRIDDQPLTREQGLVRLIVPSETDDALRQVKWISRIEFRE